jgi:hypothetical protein
MARMSDRRAAFQQYLRRFNPTAAVEAIQAELTVTRPDGLVERLTTSLDLEPAGSHLLVGGIGSGKTTTLHLVKAGLEAAGAADAVVVDVPSAHDLGKPKPGVLLALAAKVVAELIPEAAATVADVRARARTADQLRHLADGYWEDDDGPHDDDREPDGHWVKGLLEPATVPPSVAHLREQLGPGVALLERPLVLLLDGLDRLNDAVNFAKFALWDVQALAALGVGVVVVGPQALTMAANQAVRAHFSAQHLVAAPSVTAPAGLEFLRAVLRRRAGEALLDAGSAELLARASGGLLRDLINLARAAGELAYGSGAAAVGAEHAEAAAAAYGRQMLLGITQAQAARLRDFVEVPRLGSKHGPVAKPLLFTLATELDLSLLLSRLIIEVDESPLRYIPHPTIVPLIPGLPR